MKNLRSGLPFVGSLSVKKFLTITYINYSKCFALTI